MRPRLIIDFRDRCLFSLLIDGSGNIRTCTHNIGEYTLKYFFGEIFLDPDIYLNMNEERARDLFSRFKNGTRDIVRIGRENGWLRPYRVAPGQAALPLKNPLHLLSSPYLSDSESINGLIIGASRIILEFLLEPVIGFLKENEFSLKGIDVTAAVPSYFSRRARLMLHLVFRKVGFNRTTIVSREIAAAMTCIESISTGIVNILDMENEDTHLHRIKIDKSGSAVQIECRRSETIRGVGWRPITTKLGHLLLKKKKIKEQPGIYRAHIDNAFMGLIFDGISTGIPSNPPLKVTRKLVDELLLRNPGKRLLQQDPFKRLKDSLDRIQKENETVIPLGMPFMIGDIETVMLPDSIPGGLAGLLARRPLERTAYGLASGFRWLNQNPDREIKIGDNSTLRLVTQPGKSAALAGPPSFPTAPGAGESSKKHSTFTSLKMQRKTLYILTCSGAAARIPGLT